jgi:hypothetical protein
LEKGRRFWQERPKFLELSILFTSGQMMVGGRPQRVIATKPLGLQQRKLRGETRAIGWELICVMEHMIERLSGGSSPSGPQGHGYSRRLTALVQGGSEIDQLSRGQVDDSWRTGVSFGKPAQGHDATCGFANHTMVKARDYVFKPFL